MEKGGICLEMDRGGRIPPLGCVKKVGIGHKLEGKRIVRLRQISRKPQRLWEVISLRLQTRYGRHHRRRFKRQWLNSSKRGEIPVNRNGCGKLLRESRQRE
jgi:hypothetical protein